MNFGHKISSIHPAPNINTVLTGTVLKEGKWPVPFEAWTFVLFAANGSFEPIFPVFCAAANDRYRKIGEPLSAMLAPQICNSLYTHVRREFRSIRNYGSGKHPSNPAGSTINAPAA
tara:strand:- start:1399 stop:1746 length:348 start_codon:yes stop_codon:yes gene_type:complete